MPVAEIGFKGLIESISGKWLTTRFPVDFKFLLHSSVSPAAIPAREFWETTTNPSNMCSFLLKTVGIDFHHFLLSPHTTHNFIANFYCSAFCISYLLLYNRLLQHSG